MEITIEIDDLGTLLLLWRTQAHLTVREVAELASVACGRGVSHNTVNRYEMNLFPKDGPDPGILVAIVLALGHRWADLPEVYKEDVEKHAEMFTRKMCSSKELQRAA